jgi:hypothetical protein
MAGITLGPSTNSAVSHQDFYANLEDCLSSHSARSIIWMICRTVPEPPNHNEEHTVRLDTFYKEFHASQTTFAFSPLFDWSPFLMDHHRLSPWWMHDMRNYCQDLTRKLRRMPILFPTVQRMKNVSQETAMIYKTRYPRSSIFETTTRDLEVHYGRTGEKIKGGCELRSAWKFNDLKPRFYYCQGGRDYFESRYMKGITIKTMEAIKTCSMDRRRKPFNHIYGSSSDWMITWDYSAFTSSLSELKYFMFYLAEGIKSLGDAEIRLFDYLLGEVHISASELLHTYNESINIHSPFSIHRVIDRFLYPEEDHTYFQQNSGMLGVAGNIGFSTACHGSVLQSISGTERGVCVGDDAFALLEQDPFVDLVPVMSRLGRIHPEKFSFIEPEEEGPMKFLKRGVWREANGPVIDFLMDFPLACYVDERYGTRTIPPNFDEKKRLKTFSSQVGSLLWSVFANTHVEDQDVSIISVFLQAAYSRLRLPFGGKIGTVQPFGDSFQVQLFLPSIKFDEYDPRYRDWLEHAMDGATEGVSVPIYVSKEVPRIPTTSILYAAQSKVWRALEDLEIVRTEEQREMIILDNETNRRKVKQLLRRTDSDLFPLLKVFILVPIPERFLFIFQPSLLTEFGSDISDGRDLF